MVNFGNIDINPYIPCLIEDEFLKENIDRYTQVCLEIMKINFDKDSSYEEIESELCDINTYSDRKLQLIADYFDQKDINYDATLFSIYGYTSFSKYELLLSFYIYDYIGPLNLDLVLTRKEFLSKTDALAIKIMYSLHYWYMFDDVITGVFAEMGILSDPKPKILLNKYKSRYITYLYNHKSKNEQLNELIQLALKVYLENPCISKYAEDYNEDEYCLGYCLEGFYSFEKIKEETGEDVHTRIENHFISEYGEEGFFASYYNISYDLRYFLHDIKSLPTFCINDILSVYLTYSEYIWKWNKLYENLKSNYQLKLEI